MKRAPPSGEASIVEPAAVQVDGVLHHGQTEAVAGHVLVRAHPAPQHARAILGRDPRAVVLDDEAQAVARVRLRIGGGREPHAAAAPLAGVVEQVAEQLGEVAAVADELRAGGHCELEREVLARIDLQQRDPQLARRSARPPPAPAPSSAPPEAAARFS